MRFWLRYLRIYGRDSMCSRPNDEGLMRVYGRGLKCVYAEF